MVPTSHSLNPSTTEMHERLHPGNALIQPQTNSIRRTLDLLAFELQNDGDTSMFVFCAQRTSQLTVMNEPKHVYTVFICIKRLLLTLCAAMLVWRRVLNLEELIPCLFLHFLFVRPRSLSSRLSSTPFGCEGRTQGWDARREEWKQVKCGGGAFQYTNWCVFISSLLCLPAHDPEIVSYQKTWWI